MFTGHFRWEMFFYLSFHSSLVNLLLLGISSCFSLIFYVFFFAILFEVYWLRFFVCGFIAFLSAGIVSEARIKTELAWHDSRFLPKRCISFKKDGRGVFTIDGLRVWFNCGKKRKFLWSVFYTDAINQHTTTCTHPPVHTTHLHLFTLLTYHFSWIVDVKQ